MKKAVILCFFLFFGIINSLTIDSIHEEKIIENPLRAELVLRIGSDKANEDFYRPPSFDINKNGLIYILDSGNSRIQCFSKDGKFLFSFGRRGQGPGELSKRAIKIKILSDGNIYVIDNIQRRINIYNQDGKYLYSAKTSSYYIDIELLKNTYYLLGMILKEDYKPIKVSRTIEKIDDEFGILIEPAVGILKQINQLKMPEPWRYYYSDSGFARLISTNKSELIFSQCFPYRIIKYSMDGKVLKDITGNVNFDTHQKVKFDVNNFGTAIIVSPPGPTRVLHDICVINDSQVIVPFENYELGIFYLDIYDLDLNFIARYKILNQIAGAKKGEYVIQTKIDDDYNLYVLIASKESFPRVEKYKLFFNE